MWANCRLYNQDGSDIVLTADELARRFLAAWQARGMPVTAPQPALQQLMAPQTAPHAPVTTSQTAPPEPESAPQTAAHPPTNRKLMAHRAPPPANGHAEQPAANGQAKQRPSRRQAEPVRGMELATGAAAKLRTANGHVSGRGAADGDLKLPSLPGTSPAAGPAADVDGGLQKKARCRPGLKIMLRRSSAADSIQPAAKQAQVSEAPRGRLTVKLRTSSAGVSKQEPP